MTDPTLATVDDEPWNKTAAELRAEALTERRIRHGEEAHKRAMSAQIRFDSALSIDERITRRIPITTPTGPAQYVYHAHGCTTSAECCWHCEAKCILTCWTELIYAPKDPIAKKHKCDYVVAADHLLCNTCSNKLRSQPLGERFPKTQGAKLTP